VSAGLARRIGERERVLASFLEAEQERLARVCHEMALRFARGGTLIPFGTGAAATDAAHVAVEFMHPVIVGKRALPALAPSNDTTGASAAAPVGRPDDIALAIEHGPADPAVDRFVRDARRRGLLTVALTGPRGRTDADHVFAVRSHDPRVVQEVQETSYHVLWELVHVFFEHPGLLEESCITCGDVAIETRVVALAGGTATVERYGQREDVAADLVDGVQVGDRVLCHAGVVLERLGASAGDDPSGFLYPFLASEQTGLDAVLADVRASTVRKGEDAIALRRAIDVGEIERCAAALRERLSRGGRLLAFGNGGSATDAQDVACDLAALGWPAVALTDDVATITAVGNDVGFDNVFARQLIALARPNDVALAISTSGSSPNVIAGLEEARRRGLLTCALTGYDGGHLAELDWLDHLLIARSDYIPRLQEAHATMYHLLVEAVGSAE
jgi:D-sedoheptulose 7-phosphate isomerase